MNPKPSHPPHPQDVPGSATSAAKTNVRPGHKIRPIGYKEVCDSQLRREIDAGWRYFWNRREATAQFIARITTSQRLDVCHP